MSFSPGDKVEAAVNISAGMFGQDVKAGTPGVVLSTSWSGSSVRVHFQPSSGWGWAGSKETDLDVPPDKLKKRW